MWIHSTIEKKNENGHTNTHLVWSRLLSTIFRKLSLSSSCSVDFPIPTECWWTKVVGIVSKNQKTIKSMNCVQFVFQFKNTADRKMQPNAMKMIHSFNFHRCDQCFVFRWLRCIWMCAHQNEINVCNGFQIQNWRKKPKFRVLLCNEWKWKVNFGNAIIIMHQCYSLDLRFVKAFLVAQPRAENPNWVNFLVEQPKYFSLLMRRCDCVYFIVFDILFREILATWLVLFLIVCVYARAGQRKSKRKAENYNCSPR